MLVSISNCQIFDSKLSNYSGFAEMFFSFGNYDGNVLYGFAHGLGTLEYFDGAIYQGYFFKGERHGPGVLISPWGTLKGCWFKGKFIGLCPKKPPSSTDLKESQKTTLSKFS